MVKQTISFLPPMQARQLTELAERARISLGRFASVDVSYDVNGLQLLDEWVDRHLRQFPSPSKDILTIWGAFLGEVFRRRFHGEWAIDQGKRQPRLGVICPKETRGLIFVDVMEQIQRRTHAGMAESLSWYYSMKAIEIKEVEI
ncbi:MAG: hypothetical protein JXB35_09735 [Anaerolineae bacterium]|nr:hypothetical protein [Anaerolineae bacterium]